MRGGQGEGGSTHTSMLLSIIACLILHIVLGSSIIVVVICRHCHIIHLSPSLLCGHHQVLSSMPRVAEGEGVTWQWVLWWPLGIVAVRQEKEGGRALLTCPVIAVWTMWHIPRGSLRSSPCAINQAGARCCHCGWCVCVCWSSTWGGSQCVSFSPWWVLTMQGSRHEGWWVMGMVVEGKWCLYLVLSCLCLIMSCVCVC